MIYLETVTPENWRLGLSVYEKQKRFVSDSNAILARAFAYRDNRSRAFIIYNGETPIGMAMYYDLDELKAYNFSQFFIDKRYQGNGYGFIAAKQVIEEMRNDAKFDRVILCYVDGDEAAKNLYEKIGFHLTGEEDGDEIVMEMKLV